MDQSKSGKSVTLKRTVTIKVVVTEDFKSYLQYELNESLSAAQNRMQEIEMQATPMIQHLEQQGDAQQLADVQNRLAAERARFKQVLEDIKRRMDASAAMEVGSIFIQGSVDGFTTIKEGDNLYHKLGGMEITIKDGVVQDISVPKPASLNL